jgi:hypothetical protein
MRGQRRGLLVGMAVVGAGLAVLAGAVAYRKATEPPPSAAVVALKVDVVGDSLARQASDALQAAFLRAGYDSRIETTPGEGLGGATITAHLDDMIRPPGDVLVLATSANDAVRLFDGAKATGPPAPGVLRYRELLDGVARQVPSRCVVVVNARDRTNAFYHPERAAALNAELQGLSPGYKNIVVVDWAQISAQLPVSWFVADQMHFGDDPSRPVAGAPGADAFAEALLAGVRRCPPAHAAGAR